MAEYCEKVDTSLAPDVKTAMSPQIANEAVDADSVRAIAKVNMKPEHEFIFYLDSNAGLKIIQEALDGLRRGLGLKTQIIP